MPNKQFLCPDSALVVTSVSAFRRKPPPTTQSNRFIEPRPPARGRIERRPGNVQRGGALARNNSECTTNVQRARIPRAIRRRIRLASQAMPSQKNALTPRRQTTDTASFGRPLSGLLLRLKRRVVCQRTRSRRVESSKRLAAAAVTASADSLRCALLAVRGCVPRAVCHRRRLPLCHRRR